MEKLSPTQFKFEQMFWKNWKTRFKWEPKKGLFVGHEP